MQKRENLGVAVLALVLAGCSLGGSGADSVRTGSSSPAIGGYLVGSLVTEGGVDPAPGESDIRPVKDAPILVTGTTRGGKRIERRLTTDQDGRFTVQLPAGKYKVENGVYPNVRTSVVVRAGDTAHARLIVHVV
jgi:hypothetical protein